MNFGVGTDSPTPVTQKKKKTKKKKSLFRRKNTNNGCPEDQSLNATPYNFMANGEESVQEGS